MKEKKKLLRLSLQFFGDDGADEDLGDDLYDDFDDDFYDDDEGYEDGGAEEDPSSAAGGASTSPTNEGEAEGDGADGDPSSVSDSAETPSPEGEGSEGEAEGDDADGNGDLISELRALGYVGNDLTALTKDMKAKREAKAAREAKEQRAADKADGKSHVRSGKPGKSASGDGTGGISEGQVNRFVENTGSSKEEARGLLSKHSRLINGR